MVQLFLGDRFIDSLEDLKEFVKTMDEDGADELLAYFSDGDLIQWFLEGDDECIRIGNSLKNIDVNNSGNNGILNAIANVLQLEDVINLEYKFNDYVEFLDGRITQTEQKPIVFKQSDDINLDLDLETKTIEIELRFKLLKPENDSINFVYTLNPSLHDVITPPNLDLRLDGKKNETRTMKLILNVSIMPSGRSDLNLTCGSENLLNLHLQKSDKIDKIYIEGYGYINMVKINGGSFMMGATEEQGHDASKHEKPVQKVEVKDFYLCETLVTQKLWEVIMGNNPSMFKGDKRPVTNVTYLECNLFVNKLNILTGRMFRLPTEAEWEYSAKGGNQKSKYTKFSGSDVLDDVAWFFDNGSHVTHDVAIKKPNELGLFDLSGNVWEWCSSLYSDYGGNSMAMPSEQVTRGGCVASSEKGCRTSRRYKCDPHHESKYLGFRLAM